MRRPFATRPCRTPAARLVAAGLLAISGSLLVIAANLEPDPSGVGTHRQLPAGFGAAWYSRPPPCSMILVFGIPCPTCGMTTAFAHAVRGHWLSAFIVQPAGAMLALVSMLTVVLSAYTLVCGRLVFWTGGRPRPVWIVLTCVGLVLAGWFYKMAEMR